MNDSPQALNNQLLSNLAKATEQQRSGASVTSPGPAPRQGGANVHSMLKSLDQQFVGQYVLAIENAKKFLESYMTELDSLDKRLQKANVSDIVRKAMGGNEIDSKRESLEDTLDKIQAHQKATLKRLGL